MTKTIAKTSDKTLALYDYGDFDLDTLKHEQEEAKKAGSGGKFLSKLAEGKTVLRVLPPRKGAKSPFRVVWQHYVDIPGVQGAVNFVCPRMEAKLPCRVCTKARQMQAGSNPVDVKRGERLMPTRQIFANVLNRKAPEDGVKIWKFGKRIHNDLLGIRDPDEGLGINFTHPVEGYDLIVVRKGTGQFDTEYKVAVDPKGASPLADDEAGIGEILQQRHNLDALASVPDDAEIQELLSGKKPARRDDDRAAPPRGRTAADHLAAGQAVLDDEDE